MSSKTMEQFKELILEINKMRNKENLMIENFEKSTCELAIVFHYIVKSALEGKNNCFLNIDLCPELYAKTLEGMGFFVDAHQNCFDIVDGYRIYFDLI
jgi:hypothetical protein